MNVDQPSLCSCQVYDIYEYNVVIMFILFDYMRVEYMCVSNIFLCVEYMCVLNMCVCRIYVCMRRIYLCVCRMYVRVEYIF